LEPQPRIVTREPIERQPLDDIGRQPIEASPASLDSSNEPAVTLPRGTEVADLQILLDPKGAHRRAVIDGRLGSNVARASWSLPIPPLSARPTDRRRPHEVARIAINPEYTDNPTSTSSRVTKNRSRPSCRPQWSGRIVWIALLKPTYGIPGTPDPSKIGKTESHGCVRLTNWDASELAELIKHGISVQFTD
jgi:lipoprotein-anchoring transpeptidase ErfK/SrfK